MFNWDEFRNGKVAVNCDTEEKAREFIKECHSRNLRWEFSRDNVTNYHVYNSKTCFTFGFADKGVIEFSNLSFYEQNGYKIIKWESEENQVNKIQCEICRCKPVCKEIENWKKYYEEHIKLREKSILFDKEPECPYYIEDETLPNPSNSKKINDWIEKDKNLIFKAEDINIKPMEIKFGKELECICCIENENVKDRNVDWVIALPEEILKSVRDGKYMNY